MLIFVKSLTREAHLRQHVLDSPEVVMNHVSFGFHFAGTGGSVGLSAGMSIDADANSSGMLLD